MISVLYVDDEQVLLELAQLFLEENGEFRVTTATSARQALDDPCLGSYDAIVSDYQMPGMNGIGLLKAVRGKSGDIPFILFTGRGREEVVMEAINNGADFYLQKGGEPEAQFAELAHKIRHAVKRRQAERSMRDSERRLADIIDFLPDATFAIDRDGRVIAWNRAIEEMTGVPAADMLGKGDYAYAVPFYGSARPVLIDLIDEPEEKIRPWYTNITRTGSTISAETDHTHPRGHGILILAKASRLYNREGEITGAIESIRDITDRKNLEGDLRNKHAELLASYEQLASVEEELREQYDELAKSGQRIRETGEQYRSIIENSPLGMHLYTLDGDGRLIFSGANPAADRILGVDHSRFIGKTIEEAFPQLAGTEVPERYREVVRTGRVWQIEQVTYEGEGIRGAFSVTAFRTAPGSMVATFDDITEQKQRGEQIAFTGAILSAQQETSLDAILIVDGRGKIINYNRQFITLWGIPEDLVVKGLDEPVLQYVTGQLADPGAFLARVKYLYDHPDEKSFEEILLKDGRVLERFSSPVTGSGGKYYGRIWYFRDITPRRNAENALRDAKDFAEQLIDTANTIIVALDAAGQITLFNQAAYRITGYTPQELAGKNWFDVLVPRERYPYVHEEFERIMTGGVPGEFENPVLTKNGEERYILWRNSEIRTGNAVSGILSFGLDITDRRRAEESLGQANIVVENSPVVLFRWEAKEGWPVTYVSQNVRRFGYDPEELVAGPALFSSLVYPEDLPGLAAAVRQYAADGMDRFAREYRIVTRGGEVRWVDDHTVAERDAAGMITHYQGIILDITERKRAEQALQESEENYRTLVERAEEGFWAVDAGFVTTFTNRKMQEILGYSGEEMQGRPVWDFAFPEDVPALRELLEERKAGRKSRYERRWRRRDGTAVWCVTSGSPVFSPEGTFTGSFGMFTDVTEHRRMDNELRSSEERFRNLIQNSSDMIRIIDKNGLIAYSSPSTLRLFGYDPVDVIGKDPVGFVHPDDQARVRDALREVSEGTSAGTPTEFRILHRNGHYVDVEAVASNQRATPGIDGIVVTTRPVTERKKGEASLRESERRFTTVFAKNPVALTLVSAEDGIFTDVNDAFVAGSGYSREEVIGRTAREIGIFVSPEEFGEFSRLLRSRQTVTGFEIHCQRKSGEIRTCRFSAGIIVMGGKPHILSTVEDVTDRRSAEDALRRSEEKFRLLTENSFDVIYSMDLDGKITYISPQSARFGYRPEDLVSRNIADVIAGEDLPRVLEDMRKTVASGRSTHTVFRLKGHEDHPVWLEDNGSLIRKENGIPVGISGILRDITERVHAEEALQKSEEKFRRIAEHAPDLIYRMSLPDRKYEYVSPVSVTLTGYTPEEFYADPGITAKLIHPAWREYFQRQWQELMENRAPPFYEFQIIDRAGVTRWINQRNMLVRDDTGRVIAIEGILTDVTSQKRTERALKRSELRALAVSENAGSWIWEIDAQGVYRYSSPAGAKITGYRPEDLVGRIHYYDLFDPAARDELRSRAEAGIASREPFRDFVSAVRHRNGTMVLLSMSATPVFEEDGTFTGYCGVTEDITEKERAAGLLRKSREQLAEAMDLAHIATWEYDAGTGLFSFNDRFYSLCGTTGEREGGSLMPAETYYREFLHPDDRRIADGELRKALASPDPGHVSHISHRIIRRDGTVRHVSVRIAVTRDAGGKILGLHGAIQDITDLTTAEEALRRSNRQLNLLTGITRHDILNKITVVLGFLKVLEKKHPDPDILESVKKIRSATALIKSQIEFTRVYQELGTQSPQWICLDTIMPRAGIPAGIRFETGDLHLLVFADPMLKNVFFNLLENSLSHGEKVTRIRVSSRISDGHLDILWDDDGIGIPAEEKDQIFERGFGRNTGLGMFLAREILGLTGITIRETGIPGQGARFEIRVPEGGWLAGSQETGRESGPGSTGTGS